MLNKKLGIGTIEINKKFKNEEEAFRYAKSLKEHISSMCKKNANKGWYAQAIIAISNVKKDVSYLRYINNGKIGRPKKELYIDENAVDKFYKGDYKTDWHLHVLLVSNPSYSFRDGIKDYIDKRWINISNVDEKELVKISKIYNKKVYKKFCNINIAKYFIDQCAKIVFCDFNFTNNEQLEYTLKEYYREYLKCRSGSTRLIREHIINPMSEENYLRRLKKIESKFKTIEEYFYDITKEQDEKIAENYKIRIRRNKIAKNYNKVQKINHNIILANSTF